MWCLFFIFFVHAQDMVAPRQYIFGSREGEEFSERTLHVPYTEIKPNPTLLTHSAFDNIFLGQTSVQAKTQGSPTVSLRGSSQAARVLYVLDGVPLNFADGFGGSSLFIPIEITNKVDIIEGPVSAQYGAYAMAGALHFKTKQENTPLIRLGLGSAHHALTPLTTTNLAAVAPLIQSDNHKIQASVFLENDRGDFQFDTNGTSQERKNNSQNLRRITVTSRHQIDKWFLQSVVLYAGLNKVTPGPLHTPLATWQKTEAFFTSVSAQYNDGKQSAKSILSYSSLNSKYIDFSFNSSASQKYFISQNYLRPLSRQWASVTTVDLNFNSYQASYVNNQVYNRTEPELAETLVYSPTPHFTVEPTVRYLARYNQWAGQINFPYRWEHARIWASMGQGFRPPSLTDLYSETSFFIGNSHLKPERSLQGEVGLGWDSPYMSVSTSFYITRYQELLQSTAISGKLTKQNVGKAETSGFNTGLLVPLGHFVWKLNHSLMFAQTLPDHTPIMFTPKNQFFSSLSWHNNNWSLTAQHSIWSAFYDINFSTGSSIRLNSWNGSDVLIGYQTTKSWKINFGAFNIFNNQRQLSYDFPEPQRRLFLSLEIPLRR
ncbi:MAG: TonB-dependent receptor [Bdellovibrionaceae bacterium]|nr:TonB-dependent receptor [Pseudobdellovibrionaceae bacterium]